MPRGDYSGEYLLEVRSEEIPARMLEPGVKELATRVFEELMARGIAPREVETGFTPRRLVLILAGLPEGEADCGEQVMGPPVRAAFGADGAPTPALLGFAKRTGLEPDQLARVKTDKGEYLAATRKIEGRPTRDVLAEIVPRVLTGISWAKTMRWGSGEAPGCARCTASSPCSTARWCPSSCSASRPATSPRGIRPSPRACSASPASRTTGGISPRGPSRCVRPSATGCSMKPCSPAPRRWAAVW